MTKIFQVKLWEQWFESAKSITYRYKSQTYKPNKHGLGFLRLARRDLGGDPALYGAWCSLIDVLSRHPKPRKGLLTEGGRPTDKPWSDIDIAVITHMPIDVVQKMLTLCQSKDIDWLGFIYVKDTVVSQQELFDEKPPEPAADAPPQTPKSHESQHADLPVVTEIKDTIVARQVHNPSPTPLPLPTPPPVSDETEEAPGKGRNGKFRKPTAEEVTAYAAKIEFTLDGSTFCDFYEAKGWKIGKTPMKDWEAAVRTWKKRDGNGGAHGPGTTADSRRAGRRAQEFSDSSTRIRSL